MSRALHWFGKLLITREYSIFWSLHSVFPVRIYDFFVHCHVNTRHCACFQFTFLGWPGDYGDSSATLRWTFNRTGIVFRTVGRQSHLGRKQSVDIRRRPWHLNTIRSVASPTTLRNTTPNCSEYGVSQTESFFYKFSFDREYELPHPPSAWNFNTTNQELHSKTYSLHTWNETVSINLVSYG